ncbi:MAG: DegT/DnrJ/EryC1/StrS family aminotransferase, partial [Anaerolineae bacterium]|nr:DegT/DnrJ/EryC1/StrS family aminotransferase [Anaerolineae bacterium]
VFTVSHTAVATVAAVELAGATPVLVDIDPTTFTMDPNRLEDALKNDLVRSAAHQVGSGASCGGRRGAIMPVPLYGHPADMSAILELARRFDLWVIEDGAQAHGATIGGRRVGAFGDMAAFSFYPTKNLGALGDGGALATNNGDLAERARLLREYGWRERYVSAIPGLNSRLDTLQAAVLRVKLRYLDAENERRRALAQLYTERLNATALRLPVEREEVRHVYHQYVVRTPRRDALQAYLREQGIGTLIHYPVPVHLQPAYAGRLPVAGGLSHSEAAAREVLSLPMFAELSEEQVHTAAMACRHWITSHREST